MDSSLLMYLKLSCLILTKYSLVFPKRKLEKIQIRYTRLCDKLSANIISISRLVLFALSRYLKEFIGRETRESSQSAIHNPYIFFSVSLSSLTILPLWFIIHIVNFFTRSILIYQQNCGFIFFSNSSNFNFSFCLRGALLFSP